MKKYIYPAIFQPETVGGYSVVFPDLPGCCSEGDTLEEAFEMAKDALGIYIYTLEEDKKEIPFPSDPGSIQVTSGAFLGFIELDMLAYRREHEKKSIKKTLTIPQWLNSLAEKEDINFSNVLQSALKKKLRI
jgi:predicted RNase H-like HicB family nuclease